MTTTKEKIAIMKASVRNEPIEYSEDNATWKPIIRPTWNWKDYEYRIAPKLKKTVELYQWLCRNPPEGSYYISSHSDTMPFNVIRRLDETKMIVKIEE